MTNTVTRTQAKTWTIGAQAGALICVLGAVGVGVMGLPEHQTGVELDKARESLNMGTLTNTNNNGQSKPVDPFRSADVDMNGISSRLALLDNAPTPPLDPVESEPIVDDPPPGPGGGGDENPIIQRRVKYIGFINSSTTQHAFIRIDGKQRIITANGVARTGDEQFEDLKVHRITPRFIQLSQDGGERVTINLSDKTGPSVTSTGDTTIEVAPVENANGSLLTAEEEAYIASLPVRQQQSARRRLEREKRGYTGEPVRRPTPEALVKIRGSAAETNQPSVERRNDNRNRNE